MFVEDFTGNVGIGTTAPTSALDIAGGNMSLNGGWLSGDGENEGIFVNAFGSVGIGTTTPGALLGVLGDIRVQNKITSSAGGLTVRSRSKQGPLPGESYCQTTRCGC